jgi:hypothetical protein
MNPIKLNTYLLATLRNANRWISNGQLPNELRVHSLSSFTLNEHPISVTNRLVDLVF